ncbi:MAG: ATP-dependent DNA helicase RecG [bacterium]|nr:ATP-dependent DNA helicase RecG [bacterium]
MYSLNTPIGNWPRVNKKILPALKHLGIRTISDLLLYFPNRYDDFSNLKKINEVELGETVTVSGKIEKVKVLRTARQRMFLTEVVISDETGKIRAVWFNQPYLARNLKTGDLINLSGKVSRGPSGICLQNPAHEKITNYKLQTTNYSIHTGGLIAVYPETRGITSRWLRFLIKNAIGFRNSLADSLPIEIRKKYNLPEIRQAVFSIHFPKKLSESETARRRFDFEEMLVWQLHALKEKLALKHNKSSVVKLDLELLKKFVASLPFKLTDAQRRSIWEIVNDLSKPNPMNRLLEGDVGSGKTVVAGAAVLLTVKSGYRAAFMAPTEILACQHFETLQKVLKPFGIKIGLITGSQKKHSSDTQLIIGTHALIQKSVKFENLGLVVVDEQHRFGVSQRATLQNQEARIKNLLPHFLSMSATPIPRTLALTIYGDLDLSVLDELPKNRREILTKIVEPGKRQETYNFIREEVKRGRQVFVICPRIEVSLEPLAESPKTNQRKLLLWEVKAVKEEYEKLSEKIFPDFKVAMLHGKMKPRDKKEVMEKFRQNETSILVSTSVIEVGVDVPNATIMMIEGAERFGLAQLHQFRGRVGRGQEQSFCFLFSTEDGMITRRLRAVVESRNGFELAEKDLEIRGAGEIFGVKQWGESRVVNIAVTNPKLVREVRFEALEIIRKDPMLKNNPFLLQKIKNLEKIAHLE